MSYTETMTQALGGVDYVLPTNAAAASYNSANPIDLSRFKRALYIINVGAMTASSTLDARLQACSTSNFAANVVNIGTTNIAQVVNTAPNTIVTIEVRSEQLQLASTNVSIAQALRYVRLNSTVGTAAVNYSAVGIGGDAIQKPGSANNPVAVSQAVVCTL